MIDEQGVYRFMRAVDEIGEHTHGWAGAEQIMQRLDLKMSGIVDPAHNPTTEDDETYRALARECKNRRYIKSTARYREVQITKRGKEYLEDGF